MDYPQPIYDHILVKVEQEKKSVIKHGELELIAAGQEYNPDMRVFAITEGLCVNVPRGMSKGIPYEYIVPEVEIGDIVVLHFNSIDEDSKVETNKGVFYLVPYEYVFAVIRDSEIVVIGGRVLCLPLYDDAVEEDGMMVRKTGSGIITEINVKHDFKRAILSHIGTPLKGSKELPVKAGDMIWYPKDADFENEVQGKTYFCMTQEDILMYKENEQSN